MKTKIEIVTVEIKDNSTPEQKEEMSKWRIVEGEPEHWVSDGVIVMIDEYIAEQQKATQLLRAIRKTEGK